MGEMYKFNGTDRAVISAIDALLRRLIYSGRLRPAQLVSAAKVLHALTRLPKVTGGVCVTIGLSVRIKQEGCGSLSYWQFSITDNSLELSCGGSEYTEGVGNDSFATMEWSARPGRRTEYGDTWDSAWMQHDYYSNQPVNAENLRDCEVSVEDDDNQLLWDGEETEKDVNDQQKSRESGA